jgi:predicted nucleic acid-binding protein
LRGRGSRHPLLFRPAVEFEPHPADQPALAAAALRHGLTAYDATCLVLAERTGSALASLDEQLGQAARTAGVPLLP